MNEQMIFMAMLANMLRARNVAQELHWKTKSLSKHLALGDLYDSIDELVDALAEMYMGTYGDLGELTADVEFEKEDPLAFISQLADQLAAYHDTIPQDGFIVNKFEELQELIATTKYKLEKLA